MSSLKGLYNRPVQSRRQRAEIEGRLCGQRAVSAAVHRNRTAPLRLPYVGRAEIVRWLCNPRVLLEIPVTNLYN